MPAAKYIFDLTGVEREQRCGLIRRGKRSARKVTRARILLKGNACLTDEQIAEVLDTGLATVGRIRQRFVEGGLDAALDELPRPGQRAKLNERTPKGPGSFILTSQAL